MNRSYNYILTVSCLLIATYFIGRKPEPDWDFIAYTACVFKIQNANDSLAHEYAYQVAKTNYDAKAFDELVHKNSYRDSMYKNERAFRENLHFYSVKPFYIRIAYGLTKLGLPIFQAFYFISYFSFLIVGLILLWYLFQLDTEYWIKICLFLALIFNNGWVDTAREATPDALSSLFLILISIGFIRNINLGWLFVLMLLAIMVRSDNILYCSFLLLTHQCWIARSKQYWAGLLGLALILGYFILQRYTGVLPWTTLFYHSFVELLPFPQSSEVQFSLSSYLKTIFAATDNFITPLAILMAVIFWFKAHRNQIIQREYIVFIAIGCTIIARLLLFPSIAERFYIGYFYIAVIALMSIWPKFKINQS